MCTACAHTVLLIESLTLCTALPSSIFSNTRPILFTLHPPLPHLHRFTPCVGGSVCSASSATPASPSSWTLGLRPSRHPGTGEVEHRGGGSVLHLPPHLSGPSDFGPSQGPGVSVGWGGAEGVWSSWDRALNLAHQCRLRLLVCPFDLQQIRYVVLGAFVCCLANVLLPPNHAGWLHTISPC